MPNLDVYAPFDSGPGANVTEDRWRKFMRHMLGSASGAIRGFGGEFAVFGDSSGMQVKVATGECWMRGHYGESTSQKTLPIAAANATNPRKDRVVLRADFLNNAIGVEVLTGTPAASPVAPAVTQNASIWETSLAVVTVAAGAVTIAEADVTDDRVFTTSNAKYVRRGTAPAFSLTTNQFHRLTCTDIDFRSGDVTHNAAASEYTLNRAGLWTIEGRATFAANGTGGRQLYIADPTGMTTTVAPPNIYGAQSTNGLTGMNNIVSCSATERFPAGKIISLVGWQNSGGSLNVFPIDLTFTWIGP